MHHLMLDDLAQAEIRARLAQANVQRRGHQLARVRRLTQQAEDTAQRARLSLARTF